MFFDLKKKCFYTFLFWLFFFHFYGLHGMKLRKGILKITGFFFGKKRKKRRKNTVLMEKRKNFEKKKRPGRDSNPRSSVAMAILALPYETDALPLGHRAAHSYWGKN